MADDHRPLRGIAKTWAFRTLATTRAAASLGKLAAKQVVGSVTHDDDADGLVERLDEMKGLALKFGQMASYLDGALPEKAQRALARLQSRARPLAWDQVEAALVEAYGLPVDQVFDCIDREPFAAASIGQVHRGRIDGREVAIKVQYPGIARTIEIDLGNFSGLARIGSIGTALDTHALVDELRDRFRDECDYRQEGAFQQMFRGFFAHDPRVHIPEVLPYLCRDRVLVTELVRARSFQEFVANGSAEERNRAGLLLFEVAFRSIFAEGAFNGDPHPGNYLFADAGGPVVLLDFGCVRIFEAEFVESWKRIARAMLAADKKEFGDAYIEAGFVKPDRFDVDATYEAIAYLYEPMRTSRFRYTHEYVQRSWSALLKPTIQRTNLPPQWLLVQRLQWGLNSVLAHLESEGDYATVFRAAIEAPTRTAVRPPPIAAVAGPARA